MNIKTRKYYAYTYGPNIKLAELGLTPGVAVKFGETTKQTVDKRMKQQGGTNEGFEKVKLGESYVGDNCPVYIIAEGGLNHNGDYKLGIKLIIF